MTTYYPVALDLRHRQCIVVGGGLVAERKVDSLLECQARVLVVAPLVTPRLQELARDGAIGLAEREYRPGDLAGAFLAVGATDRPQVNEAIFQEAQERGILVNVVDDPSRCNFIVPASLRRGDLTIAITTGGRSPSLARQLRQELEDLFPPEYAQHLEKLVSYRRHLRQRLPDPARREAAWRSLMVEGLLDLLRQGRAQEAWDLVQEAAAQSGGEK